jgi:hypothetical protein
MMLRKIKTHGNERGSALIEFVLCTSLLIVPLLLGTAVLGLNLVRDIQVTELCRDATHMYSQGVDFTQTSYQSELFKIAQGLNITSTSGNGVIILSTITYVDSAACSAGGYSTGNCTNLNYTVFSRQVVIGNSSLYTSAFGTPPVDTSNSDNVTQADQLTSASARAQSGGANFSLVPVTASTQFAYVGEVYFTTPDLSWWRLLGTTGIGARFVF